LENQAVTWPQIGYVDTHQGNCFSGCMEFQQNWKNALTEASQVLAEFMAQPEQMEKCQKFSQMLVDTFQNGGKVLACGNGGSHCDAMHFCEELTGRYRQDRRPLGAIALGDPSHMSCVANDFGFEHVFSRQVEALGKPEDLLLGLSTSGNSKNVILAFQAAKKLKIKTLALLGKGGGELKALADLAIIVPGKTSDRIQELHMKLVHTSIETLERQLFPDNY